MTLPSHNLALGEIFKSYQNFLKSTGYSKSTVKNYLSDLRHLVAWLNSTYAGDFHFSQLTESNLQHYRNYTKQEYRNRPSIISRRLSSLTTFLAWAKKEGIVPIEKIRSLSPILREPDDTGIIPHFRDYLKKSNYTSSTIKNYVVDLRHLISWVNTNYEKFKPSSINETSLRSYRSYLKEKFRSRPSISARRLSSLRKFLHWAQKLGLVTEDLLKTLQKVLEEPIEKPVSPVAIPPTSIQIVPPTPFPTPTPPVDISTYKVHQKVLHHIKHTRPGWYHRYHQRDWASTLHTVIMVVFAVLVGSLFLYTEVIQPILEQTQKQFAEGLGNVLAAATPPRVLSFQGRLTDASDVPVTSATNVVFKIYSVRTGGSPLWTSKTWSVTPDQNGIFSVCLGGQDTADDCLLNGVADTAIPSTLFTDNAALYLGVTAGVDSEMTPRQRIASVSYALNSDALEGFHGSQTAGANEVPILNATGDLSLLGTDGTDDDCIYFDTGTSESFCWDDNPGEFDFTDDVTIVGDISTATSGSVISVYSAKTLNPASASTATLIGYYSQPYGQAQNATINTIRSFSTFTWPGVGDDNPGTTDITWAQGFYADGQAGLNAAVEVVVGNYAAFYSDDIKVLSANDVITNAYGLYIEDFTGDSGAGSITNAWGIYQAGANDINVFAGNTTIGSTTAGSTILNITNASTTDLLSLYTTGAATTANALIISANNASGVITDAIDVADAEIVNALNAGSNIILMNDVSLADDSASANTIGLATGDNFTVINGAICVDNDGNCTSLTAGQVRADSFPTTGGDVAEMYYSPQTLESGEVVMIDFSNQDTVRTTISPYSPTLLGVVSTEPGVILRGGEVYNDETRITDPNFYPIAIIGRTPVKVNSENGPIAVGDLITSSSTPGVGMKATRAGYVIGRALTAFSCPDSFTSEVLRSDSSDGGGLCQGTIVAFVNTHYSNPTQLDNYGSLIDPDPSSTRPGLATSSALLSLDSEDNLVASVSAGTKFVWENGAGEVVAWISDAGEAFFKSIRVLTANIGRLFIQDEVVIAKEAGISGGAKFDKDDTEVEIETKKVDEDSLIYITPTTRTDGLVLYVKEIEEGKAFTVALDQSSYLKDIIGLEKEATPSASLPIKFNWLIINQE